MSDETFAFISQKQIQEEKVEDADYDFKEFDETQVEEAEDRVYAEYKRCLAMDTKMETLILNKLAYPV